MNNATSKIKEGMARKKISNDYQLAELIGISRQSLSRKLMMPNSFSPREIKAIADVLSWSDLEIGEFIRTI